MKNVGLAIGGFIAFVLIVFLLMMLGGVFTVGGSAIKATVDKKANPYRETSILFNPNNSIGRYEDFYDNCRSVVALNSQVVYATDDYKLALATYDKKDDPFGEGQKELGHIRSSIRALKNQIARIAEQYNADSSKTTRAQFKAADLPYTIDPPYSEIECGSPKEAGR